MKAEKMARWSIGIITVYISISFILFSLAGLIPFDIVSLFGFMVFPVLVITWILSIWSIYIEKTSLGSLALYFCIFFSLAILIFIGVLIYLFKDFCVVC